MLYDFLCILEDSAKWLYYLGCRFARKSPEVLRSYDSAIGLRFGPQKDLGLRNWTLGHRPTALRPNSGEPAVGSDRTRRGKRLAGPTGSIPGLGWVESAAGGAAQRRRGWAAVGARAPANEAVGAMRERHMKLPWSFMVVVVCSHSRSRLRTGSLPRRWPWRTVAEHAASGEGCHFL